MRDSFHYNNKIINMLDNEYAHITLEWQYKKNEKEEYSYEIGMHDCQETTHLNTIYSEKDVRSKFGSIYCANKLEEHHVLFGQSQHGFPTKRIWFSLNLCDQK